MTSQRDPVTPRDPNVCESPRDPVTPPLKGVTRGTHPEHAQSVTPEPPTCQICAEPSRFTICGGCHAERQQHLRDKARRRHAEWAKRMTTKETNR